MAWMALLVICTVAPEQSNGWTPAVPRSARTSLRTIGLFLQPTAVLPDSRASRRMYPITLPDPHTHLRPACHLRDDSPTQHPGIEWLLVDTDAGCAGEPLSVGRPRPGPPGHLEPRQPDATGEWDRSIRRRRPPSPSRQAALAFPPPRIQNEVLPPGYSGFGGTSHRSPRAVRREVLPPAATGGYPNSQPSDPRSSGREISVRGLRARERFRPHGQLSKQDVCDRTPGHGPGSSASATSGQCEHRSSGGLPVIRRSLCPPTRQPTRLDRRSEHRRTADPRAEDVPRSTDGGPCCWQCSDCLARWDSIVYLGWIAWDLHGRYQDVVADLHDLENQFDERTGELVPESDRSVRRESRRVTAAGWIIDWRVQIRTLRSEMRARLGTRGRRNGARESSPGAPGRFA